jgi:hypothetical protein
MAHLCIIGVAAMSIVTFLVADAEVTGQPSVGDALGFTAAFVATAYYVGWLPSIWRWSKGTRFEVMVMPAFMVLTMTFLYRGSAATSSSPVQPRSRSSPS